jgi:hypothetical protein
MSAQFNIPTTSRFIESLLTDETGQCIGKVVYEVIEQTQLDGSMIQTTRAAFFQLADGRIISTPMLQGNNAIELHRCAVCIKPRLFGKSPHGLTSTKKTCFDCGQCMCPKHSKRSRVDHHWRCPSCHRKHKRISWLRWVFFKYE